MTPVAASPPDFVSRVARVLARQEFSARYQLELSMFGAAASRRRDLWVETHWPGFVDRAREILSGLLVDVLLVTYRDEAAVVRRRERAESSGDALAMVAAATDLACACTANAIGATLAELFDGAPAGASPEPPDRPAIIPPAASEGAACSRS